MKLRGKQQVLRKIIAKVNSGLGKFKKDGWIRVERLPGESLETCTTLEQFVEATFNRACFNDIPELREAEILLSGHLFGCILEEPDEKRKRFKVAHIVITDKNKVMDPDENLINELYKVQEYLGGTTIKFNSVKVKIKFEIV